MASPDYFSGKPCEGIRYLSLEDLKHINSTLIKLQTPSELNGVLKPDQLESSQQRPAQVRYYEGTDDIFRLTSRLMASIIFNHPFNNANKRTAAAAGAIFLLLNGFELTGPGEEMIALLVGLDTKIYSEDDLECWLADWSREYDAEALNLKIEWTLSVPLIDR